MAQINYPDRQILEGDQIVTYSKEGVKCKRIWTITSADNSDPQGTLLGGDPAPDETSTGIYGTASDTPNHVQLPTRGAPHPTIIIKNAWNNTNAFCADVITIKALTSTQALYEVEYAVLNAITQEPSTKNDSSNAQMTICASIQTITTSVDVAGQQLVIPYATNTSADPTSTGSKGDYDIIATGIQGGPITEYTSTTFSPFVPGTPAVATTASIQVPTTLFRFQRRETRPRDPSKYLGFLNSSTWDMEAQLGTGAIFPQQSFLCTRLESETQDNGYSYIVTYEFQLSFPVPVEYGMFVPPAAPLEGYVGTYASKWDIGAYYVLPTGIGTNNVTPPGTTLGQIFVNAGQIPPDADPYIFKIYGEVDFNGQLFLT